MVKFTIEVEIDDNYERDYIVMSCLQDILDDIYSTYSNNKNNINSNNNNNKMVLRNQKNKNKMEIENDNSEQNQMNKQISIKNIAQQNNLEIIRTIPFRHFYNNKEYHLYHLKVHQQFVSNVCGYHATFNILEVLETLKSQLMNNNNTKQLRILSSGEFWKFKNNISQYIWQYKLKYELNNDKWPWREKDVHQGDFERTYLNICLKYNQRFQQALTSDKNNKFHVLYYTWEYQFGRMLSSEAQQKQLQEMINEFIKFNKKDENLVFVFMLGITNHWGSFIAHKYNNEVEFWYFDSRNRDYLEWDEDDIQKYIIEAQEKRKRLFQKPWTDFDIQVQTTCVHDIQESLETLCQCLIGNMTLHDYQCNNLFLVFEKQFRKHISYDDVLNQKNMDKQIQICQIYAKDYYYTVQSFFRTTNVLKFLTPTNQDKFLQMKQIFGIIQKSNKIMHPSTYHKCFIEPLNALLARANL